MLPYSRHRAGHPGSMQPLSGRGCEEHLHYLLAAASHSSLQHAHRSMAQLTYSQGQDAHSFPLE